VRSCPERPDMISRTMVRADEARDRHALGSDRMSALPSLLEAQILDDHEVATGGARQSAPARPRHAKNGSAKAVLQGGVRVGCAAHLRRREGQDSWPRAQRASKNLTRRRCSSAASEANGASSATGREAEHRRGSRCAAPTAWQAKQSARTHPCWGRPRHAAPTLPRVAGEGSARCGRPRHTLGARASDARTMVQQLPSESPVQ